MPTNYNNGTDGGSGYIIAIVILILVIIIGVIYFMGGFNNLGFGGERETNTINVDLPESPDVNMNLPGGNSPTDTSNNNASNNTTNTNSDIE